MMIVDMIIDRKHHDNHHCGCDDNRSHHHDDCHSCGGHRGHHGHCHSVCCHRPSCRRSICDNHFSIRLGGLHQGLNFRLRQLLGCHVDIHLEDNKKVHGEVCFVGSNFVEMFVDDKYYQSPPAPAAGVNDADENGEETGDVTTPPHRRKKHSVIFSIDKINRIKHHKNDCKC